MRDKLERTPSDLHLQDCSDFGDASAFLLMSLIICLLQEATAAITADSVIYSRVTNKITNH